MSREFNALSGRVPVGWRVWEGIGGTLYARYAKISPPIVLRAASADELVTKVQIAEIDIRH